VRKKWKAFWPIDQMHQVVVHLPLMVIKVNVHIILRIGSSSITDNFLISSFSHRKKSLHQKVYNNVLELIGDTPLVRVNRLARDAGVKCNLCK
jgi:hypothetical protein